MPIVKTRADYIVKVLDEGKITRPNIFLLALLDKLSSDVFPLAIRGDELRKVREEDRKTFKKLYEGAGLTVMDIGYLTEWTEFPIYQHLRAMGTEFDPKRRSKLTKETRELEWDTNILYFHTKQPIVETVKENVIKLKFPKAESKPFFDYEGLEEYDLSELVREYVDHPYTFFFSLSKGYLGLKGDGFFSEYSNYVAPLFQNAMHLALGLADLELVSVE